MAPPARPGVVATITPTRGTGRKVARFITPTTAQSSLPLAADGKLPELRLKESLQDPSASQEAKSLNPFILLVAVCVSLGLSLVLVFMDVSPKDVTLEQKKQQARSIIDTEYIGTGEEKRLEPYQLDLREALAAFDRGDYKKEREYYRKVLDMLRAERLDPKRGVTGSPARDRRLEELITILLSTSP